MRCVIVVAIAGACGGGHAEETRVAPPPSNHAVDTVPSVELVVTDSVETSESPRTRVRFAQTTASGIVVTRTVLVPGYVTSLAWTGAEPVVVLADNTIGRITAAGFVPVAAVPEAMWATSKPVTNDPYAPTDHFDTPRWRMLADDTHIWQARCDWGWDLPHGIAHHCVPEGGRCDAWVYAQVWPGVPTTASLHAPSASFDTDDTRSHGSIPAAAPAPAIHAEVTHAADRAVLRCTDAAATIQYPSDEDRDMRDNDGDGVSELTWLSTTPPMFAVTRRVGCRDTMQVIFEGCTQSELWAGATILGGPRDLLGLWHEGDRLALRWHDRDLGWLDRVSQLAFAPTR